MLDLKKQILFFVLIIMGFMSAFAEGDTPQTKQTVVTLDKAGTLADKIDDEQKYKITDLKVIGEINGSDVRLLRDMAGCDYSMMYTDGKLARLDLSEARIVEGGDYYFARFDMAMEEIQYTKNDEIGDEFFFCCNELKSVILPSTAKSIGFCSFSVCKKLTDVTIPEGITSIGSCAFEFDESLTEIKLPSTISEIKTRAFYNCTGLKKINIPNGVKELDYCCFADCRELEDFTLPPSITTLGMYVLSGCTSLKSITIPESVTNIEKLAFYGCTGLESVYVKWETPLTIEEKVFTDIDKTRCTLYVPTGTLSDYKATVWGTCFDKFAEYTPTGINQPYAMNKVKELARYSADGKRLKTQTRGLNIVSFSDGSVKKINVE